MSLALAEANKIVRGEFDKARQMNTRISVGVCDAGGRLTTRPAGTPGVSVVMAWAGLVRAAGGAT